MHRLSDSSLFIGIGVTITTPTFVASDMMSEDVFSENLFKTVPLLYSP